MISYLVPGEWIVGVQTALLAAVIYVALQVSRTRERLSRIEEWIRIHERCDRLE